MTNMNALMAQEQRRQAVLGRGIAVLKGLLCDGMFCVHSTGGRDAKPTYLDKLAAGILKYLSLFFEDLQVHGTGEQPVWCMLAYHGKPCPV